MKNITIYAAFVAVILFAGCGSDKQTTVPPVAFPNIALPSYIYDQTQAQEYLVKRYWDNFFKLEVNCTDSSAVNGVDSVSFEQAFGMYAQLLTLVGKGNLVENSVLNLYKNLDSLALNGEKRPLMQVMNLTENYFYHPNSPVLNEEIYLCALNGILDTKSLTDLDKMQYEYQYRICSLNRVGTPAADFEFRQLVSGENNFRNSTLYRTDGEFTLLFFNNPDCYSCAEILDAIKGSPLQQMVQRGELKVLAMYIDEDLTAWRENRAKYPQEWIYAYDEKLVLRDNNLYGLRAIPSLYLLDKEKRVLLKDAPVNMVIDYLLNLHNSL